MFEPLRHRPFARLWAGQAVSLVGDRALMLALPYFVYDRTGSTLATAALALANYLPGLLFGSFAGVLADRWDRRRVLVWSNLVQAAVVLLLLLAPFPGLLWVAFVAVFAEHAVSMLLMPASGALLPTLVPPASLVRANALASLASTSARLLGPILGGLLAARVGLASVVVFDALTFLAAAALFAGLPAAPPRSTDRARPATLRASWGELAAEWRGGLAQVRGRPALVALFAVFTLTSLGGSLVDPFSAAFARDRLGAGPDGLAALGTAGALGMLAAGAVAGRLGPRLPARTATWVGTVAVGAAMIALYVSTSFGAALAWRFALGLPLVLSNVAAVTLLQEATPDEYRGRVYGALGTANALVGVLAAGLAAALGGLLGPVAMLVLAGAITVLAGLLGGALLPRGEAKAASPVV